MLTQINFLQQQKSNSYWNTSFQYKNFVIWGQSQEERATFYNSSANKNEGVACSSYNFDSCYNAQCSKYISNLFVN
jgi:hypothetical protein